MPSNYVIFFRDAPNWVDLGEKKFAKIAGSGGLWFESRSDLHQLDHILVGRFAPPVIPCVWDTKLVGIGEGN